MNNWNRPKDIYFQFFNLNDIIYSLSHIEKKAITIICDSMIYDLLNYV